MHERTSRHPLRRGSRKHAPLSARIGAPLKALAAACVLMLALALAGALLVWAEQWQPLALDRLHDPASPAIGVLQEPAEALSQLPPDSVGNRVRWVEALEEGYIAPRTNLYETTEVQVLDLDVLMDDTGAMPIVRFPHDIHTEWLDCSNCHPKLFAKKAGATPVNMFAVLQGEYCGRCHGAVSFPLTECNRCHSIPRPK